MFNKLARKLFSTTSSAGGNIGERLESRYHDVKGPETVLGLFGGFAILSVGGALFMLNTSLKIIDHKFDLLNHKIEDLRSNVSSSPRRRRRPPRRRSRYTPDVFSHWKSRRESEKGWKDTTSINIIVAIRACMSPKMRNEMQIEPFSPSIHRSCNTANKPLLIISSKY
jgi:hypothetical protein